MKIVVSGYYGSKNGGDEAMLAAMLEVLREEISDLQVTVISLNPEYTRLRHKVDAVPMPDIFSIIKKIRAADLLISGGGSLLQNVTSGRSLYYYLTIIFFALIFGRKVMLYAQGIGPIRGALAHKLMNLIVNRVDLITVRDRGSLEELSRLKITRPKIFCTADPVLAIKPVSLKVGEEILARYSVNKLGEKFIGVAVRHWMGWEKFQIELAAALDKIVEVTGAKIIFIPMKFPEDIRSAQSTAERMKKNCVVLEEEFATREILSLVGCMNLLIGVRLHALIFAGVMNIPMLGISYDPKIERFLDSIGEKPLGNMADVTADKIFDATIKKLSEQKEFRDDTLLKKLGELARQNAKLAVKLVEGKLS
ncbi:MAG: polysaccharide pyruvyl transferase CsaB [Selenomonadaceae bacterium]|nr:polysaccharide pyruvyl transferase CsaB [Selenomonadaceae bacterium]